MSRPAIMPRPAGDRAKASSAPLLASLILALLGIVAGIARADIYRWEDGHGTLHFTDDPSAIPAPFRGSTHVILKEPPPGQGDAFAPPTGGNGSDERGGDPPADGKKELAAHIERLRAKIEAKEKLIRAVDAKRSLAINPYRNRFVDPGDLELYGKYQAELPADRAQLKELEERLEALR